jgi:acyl-CoA reductase-like NAD-dependent aldehyde dehydrogenase
VGQRLVEDRRVDAVSFTGSVHTGAQIAAACSRRMVRHQLEMGGKNPLVVLDDADLDNAVECAIQGAFHSTGQRCTASSRLIVTRGIYARFRDALVERTRALRVGHALQAGTQIGPVVDARQLEQDLRYIEIGRAEGARLACGGARVERDTPGHYLAPALFVDADNTMRICQEEIFGPVAALIPARDAEEALFLANQTPFGLSAGVCTTSLRRATQFQRQLRAGMVMVNTPTAGVDYHVPFGGTRASSFGSREQGTYARDFFTQVKTSYVCP